MARRKRLGYPHYKEVVKLTLVFSVLFTIFGFSFAFMLGAGRLGFADAARGGIKGKSLPTNDPVFCADVYLPVCGADGITYSNECYANNAVVEIECESTCPCGGYVGDTPY